jgi:hypothetical protein
MDRRNKGKDRQVGRQTDRYSRTLWLAGQTAFKPTCRMLIACSVYLLPALGS